MTWRDAQPTSFADMGVQLVVFATKGTPLLKIVLGADVAVA